MLKGQKIFLVYSILSFCLVAKAEMTQMVNVCDFRQSIFLSSFQGSNEKSQVITLIILRKKSNHTILVTAGALWDVGTCPTTHQSDSTIIQQIMFIGPKIFSSHVPIRNQLYNVLVDVFDRSAVQEIIHFKGKKFCRQLISLVQTFVNAHSQNYVSRGLTFANAR